MSTAAKERQEADRIYRVILKYAGQVGREQDQRSLLRLLAGMARDLVGADRSSIWLVRSEVHEISTIIADGVCEIKLSSGIGLVGQCIETGESSLVNSPASDPRFSKQVDLMTGYETEALLTVPMRAPDGKIIGACQVLNKKGGFDSADIDLISFSAAFSAQALENFELQHERDNARRLKDELTIAREVQQRLFPSLPATDNLDCAAICRPAREVGGDFYGFWTLSEENCAIALGDVSGKGISAALLMASLQAWLHSLVLHSLFDATKLCTQLNRIVFQNTAADRYSSLFLAHWDRRNERLTYVNAGQTPPIIYQPEAEIGNRIRRLTEGGLPIGLIANSAYSHGEVKFGAGMWLVCFSDGLTEAMNLQGQEWGDDNVISTIVASADTSAAALINRTIAAALEFTGTAEQHDDMTIIATRAK